MCVIAFVGKEDARPSAEIVAKMFSKNPHGAGIAYRRHLTDAAGNELPAENGKHKLEVFWEKGLGLERIQELAASVPTPFVLHFRISSNDDRKNPAMELTHPFPITSAAQTWLTGKTTGGVLFHNGHFGGWRADLKQFLLLNKGKYPTGGRMSDTRAMAICSSYMGPGYMDLIEEKGIAFYPDSVQIYEGKSGWDSVNGMWVSNLGWQSGGAANLNDTGAYNQGWRGTTSRPRCKFGACTLEFGLDAEGYCKNHTGGKPINPTLGGQSPATSTTGGTNVVDLRSRVNATPQQEQVQQPKLLTNGGSSPERGPFADAIQAVKALKVAIAARNNGTGTGRAVKTARKWMRRKQSDYRSFCEKNKFPLNTAALEDPELTVVH